MDSGFFRRPVVRSGGAAHRPAAPPRWILFPVVESLVAPVRPSPAKDGPPPFGSWCVSRRARQSTAVQFPVWEDFRRLAFDEIRFYGATSVQVMRRMKALVNQLISVLPEERRPALRHWRERLQSTVERTYSDTQDKLDASDEDPQGLGSSRRKHQAVSLPAATCPAKTCRP